MFDSAVIDLTFKIHNRVKAFVKSGVLCCHSDQICCFIIVTALAGWLAACR